MHRLYSKNYALKISFVSIYTAPDSFLYSMKDTESFRIYRIFGTLSLHFDLSEIPKPFHVLQVQQSE